MIKLTAISKMKSAPPRLLWDNVKDVIQVSDNAYLVFDDTVIDKRYSIEIETTKRQYSAALPASEYSVRRTALATSMESSKELV